MSRSILFVIREGGLTGPADVAASPLLQLVPATGALAALRRFSGAGFGTVVLQPPGLRDADAGRIPARDEDAFLRQLLEAQGIDLLGVERCRHAADEQCDCAPPGLGLVRTFLAGTTLDRERSIVIGGTVETLALATNMGLRGYQLEPGNDTAGKPASTWPGLAHTLLDAPRTASVTRRTRETSIDVSVDLDRAAEPEIATGIGFFDHMLEQLGKHGGFALRVSCDGDLEVDEHHTVEDVALTIGEALRKALGTKLGIARYGFVLPMDEACAQLSVDLSGRAYFVFDGSFSRDSVGGLPTELVPHFFRSLSDALGATVHLTITGDNDHHKVEASFKAMARALRQAFRRDGDDLPSTKGAL